MNIITILKTALEFFELVTKLVTKLAAWVRSRRRARQRRSQSIGRVPHRREPWISRRFAKRPNFAGIDRSPVATSTDDVLLRPIPEQQPFTPYTTRPVLAKDLTRR
jgi:hypothetical protein